MRLLFVAEDDADVHYYYALRVLMRYAAKMPTRLWLLMALLRRYDMLLISLLIVDAFTYLSFFIVIIFHYYYDYYIITIAVIAASFFTSFSPPSFPLLFSRPSPLPFHYDYFDYAAFDYFCCLIFRCPPLF